jgi:hypothetical protein
MHYPFVGVISKTLSIFINKLLNLTKAEHHCWCNSLIDNTSQAVDNMSSGMQETCKG